MVDCRMIDSYSFGKVVVNGTEYNKDIIILPERIITNWWRLKGHELHIDDISEIVATHPDILIVGTGAYGRMRVLEDTRKHLESEGIELLVHETKKACEIYNRVKDTKRTALALHLTC